MALKVHDINGCVLDFPTAHVYHVDEDGMLHLSEPPTSKVKQHPMPKNMPVGSVAAGKWIAVVKVPSHPALTAGPFTQQSAT